ncbi:MAG: hypothetical protein JO000_22750 [Alphaproteobacteria bacterium]|nr:hypothetical protein [Alphaproteobacteria bacterium]
MKKIAGILGAAVAATAMSSVTPTPSLAANSFADLLEPVPNAVAALKADDARAMAERSEGRVQLAQWHHHHHRFFRRWHHHHHHHHRFFRRWHHHHHHHHHHHQYWR